MSCMFSCPSSADLGESTTLVHSNQNTINNIDNSDSLKIDRCVFTGGSYGFYARAKATSGKRMWNCWLTNNTFTNQERGGINATYLNEGGMNGNAVTASEPSSSSYRAISVSHCDGTQAMSNWIDVSSNLKAVGLYTGNSNGYVGDTLYYANNYIKIDGGSSSKGIDCVNNGHVDYAFNTIVMGQFGSGTYALYETNFGGDDIRVINNIMINYSGGAIYRAQDATNFVALDHNLYFNWGGTIADINGYELDDLAAIFDSAGFDSKSRIKDPELGPSGMPMACNIDSLGMPIAITEDANQGARNATHPDVGFTEYVSQACLITALNNSVDVEGLTISPNPSDNYITSNQEGEITIYNSSGQFQLSSSSSRINVSSLEAGIYNVVLSSSSGLTRSTFIKL